jgi:hypothetical protein
VRGGCETAFCALQTDCNRVSRYFLEPARPTDPGVSIHTHSYAATPLLASGAAAFEPVAAGC